MNKERESSNMIDVTNREKSEDQGRIRGDWFLQGTKMDVSGFGGWVAGGDASKLSWLRGAVSDRTMNKNRWLLLRFADLWMISRLQEARSRCKEDELKITSKVGCKFIREFCFWVRVKTANVRWFYDIFYSRIFWVPPQKKFGGGLIHTLIHVNMD